ncbi:MAG TPA: SPOR domain-containing protein [Gammaproteobacteria bacterium]|nr:SPOR domain-containing protein [Gammaproteobacteria bacterium]
MRWLFLFVLSLNLAYIAWQLNREPDVPAPAMQPLKGVPPIVLLGELSDKEAPAQLATGQNTAGEPQAEKEMVMQPAAAAPDAQVDAETTPVIAEKSAEPSGEADAAKTNQAVSEADEAGPARGNATVAAAVTEEKMTAAGTAEQSVTEQSITEQSITEPSASCYTLGPFRDIGKLRALTRDIRSYVETADFRGKEKTEQSLYWVYISPLENRKEAIATGKRLRAKKIKDFYIIREGENINGISLGYFRNKKGAEGLVRRVQKQGFDARIEPVFKTYTVYWLDYRLAPGKRIPQSIIDRHVKADKAREIKNLKRDCDGG